MCRAVWPHAKKKIEDSCRHSPKHILDSEARAERSVDSGRQQPKAKAQRISCLVDEVLVTSMDVMGSSAAASAGSSCSRRSPSARIFSSYLHSQAIEHANHNWIEGEGAWRAQLGCSKQGVATQHQHCADCEATGQAGS